MIINSLHLENFQSYNGKVAFSFERGVNIVSGRNGSGKSKLFNAFYYVLFQAVYSEIQEDGWYKPTNSQRVNLANERAKKHCAVNDILNCGVKLELQTRHYANDNEGEVTYVFERGYRLRKLNQEAFEVTGEEAFTIEIKLSNGETEPVHPSDLDYLLNEIFPAEIRKYMWFQGETINELIDFRSGVALKEAIKNISYYPFYERIEAICQLACDKNEAEQQKAIKKLAKNQTEISELTARISDTQSKLDSYNKTLEDSKNVISLRKEALKKLEENRDRLTEIDHARNELNKWQVKKDDANTRQDDTRAYFKNRFSQVWMFYGLEGNFESLANRLEGLSDELLNAFDITNPVPYFVPGKSHIQRCITDETCHFCEREAKKGSQAYASLEKRMEDVDKFEFEQAQKRNTYKAKSEKLTVLKENASNRVGFDEKILTDIQGNEKKNNEAHEIYKKCVFEIKKNEQEIEHNAKLTGAKDASKALHLMRLYDKEITMESGKRDRAIREISLLSSLLEKDKRKFQELSENIDDRNENVVASKHFRVLVGASKILKQRAHESLISNIEAKSNEIYGNFLKQSGAPQGKIVIDEYEVEIMDGHNIIDINKGHSTVAKMSVINSVLSLSASRMGKAYPLISDAPSSVFDSQNVTTYTQNIGQEFEQVIIMSKDYSETAVMDKLKNIKGVSTIYEIKNEKVGNESDEALSEYETKITKLL